MLAILYNVQAAVLAGCLFFFSTQLLQRQEIVIFYGLLPL
jgi:hypothetical protein